MPAFLYTIAGLTIFTWWGWIKVLTTIKPDTTIAIIVFLLLTQITLTLTLSLPIYFVLHKKAPKFTPLKPIYRKSFKNATTVALGITGLMAMRAFGLGTLLNMSLLATIFGFLIWQVFGRSRLR